MKRTYIFASAPYAQAWCALSNKISHEGNESKHAANPDITGYNHNFVAQTGTLS